jgi:hypothetical protein
MDKLLKTIEFPTDIIEEGFVAARIYERHGQPYAVLAHPNRELSEEETIRLECISINLFLMEKKNEI